MTNEAIMSGKQIEELVAKFEKKTLPKTEWTHHAHLTVGVYYCYHHPLYNALCIMKANIILYNDAIGTKNSPTTGYHETLTIFWLTTINSFLSSKKDRPLFELCNEFLVSQYADKGLPLTYYSKEKLFSVEARARWVEPDRSV